MHLQHLCSSSSGGGCLCGLLLLLLLLLPLHCCLNSSTHFSLHTFLDAITALYTLYTHIASFTHLVFLSTSFRSLMICEVVLCVLGVCVHIVDQVCPVTPVHYVSLYLIRCVLWLCIFGLRVCLYGVLVFRHWSGQQDLCVVPGVITDTRHGRRQTLSLQRWAAPAFLSEWLHLHISSHSVRPPACHQLLASLVFKTFFDF